jgi:hypothetical protein
MVRLSCSLTEFILNRFMDLAFDQECARKKNRREAKILTKAVDIVSQTANLSQLRHFGSSKAQVERSKFCILALEKVFQAWQIKIGH